MAKPSLRQSLENVDQKEQSKDMMKEEMEALMRRKVSAMKLDVQKQMRSEKEHAERSERRQEREMHSDIEVLRKRLLHQREHMESEIVQLSTKEHHYKSEDEKDADNDADTAARFKQLQYSTQVRMTATTASKVKRRTDKTERKRESALKEEVKTLKAKFVQEKANIKAQTPAPLQLASSVQSASVHPAGTKIEDQKRRNIEQIEHGYFKHFISADDAREKMAHFVVEHHARKAADTLQEQIGRMRAREAKAEAAVQVAHLLPAVRKMQTLAQPEQTLVGVLPKSMEQSSKELSPATGTALPAAESATFKIATAAAVASLAVPPVVAPSPFTASVSFSGAAKSEEEQHSANEDSQLKTKLESAIAQRDAAEAEAEGFLLEAKNRQLAVLENELALNQRVVVLREMQEDAADRGLMLPALIQQQDNQVFALDGSQAPLPLSPSLDTAGIDWPVSQDSTYAQPSLAVNQDARAMKFGDRMVAKLSPLQASDMGSVPEHTSASVDTQRANADSLEYASASWDQQSSASGQSFADRLEKQRPQAITHTQARLRLAIKPAVVNVAHRHVPVSSSEMGGVAVDRVPEWSPRVKALEDRAVTAGYHLVPLDAHYLHVSDVARRSAIAMAQPHGVDTAAKMLAHTATLTAPKGRQTLASIKPTQPSNVVRTSVVQAKAATHEDSTHEDIQDKPLKNHIPNKHTAGTNLTSEEQQKLAQGDESPVANAPDGLNGASMLDQIGITYTPSLIKALTVCHFCRLLGSFAK